MKLERVEVISKYPKIKEIRENREIIDVKKKKEKLRKATSYNSNSLSHFRYPLSLQISLAVNPH